MPSSTRRHVVVCATWVADVETRVASPRQSARRRLAAGRDPASGQLKPWETLSDRRGPVGALVRFAGLAPNWKGHLLEVASLVVLESRRGEGIGSALLRRLVESATGDGAEVGEVTLCLLTLRSTVPFYGAAGFAVIENPDDIPRPLQAERAAGSLVAAVVAQEECVAMRLER